MRRYLLTVPVLLAALVAASTARTQPAGGPLQVVAAENFWGSIAAQLGGDRVHVTSVITNPATDPHDYEPTAVDARTIAGARMVIENGIGYDPWAARLVAASPLSGRVVLDVGKLVGVARRRQPASLVLAGERPAGDRRDRPRLHAARPEGRRRTSAGSSRRSRRTASRSTRA